MKIKQLIIQGFGQFINQSFDFKDGLNIIEGLNESGKTTLHAFIEAMFFGFINPDNKRKTYLEDYDRYEPKTTDVYGGSLIIEHDNTRYRITRNLKKQNRNPLQITKETTGETITDTLDIDPISKTADVGKWLNLPYPLYQNTLSIRQLEAKTKDNVGDLLMTRLSNLTTSATETLAPSKAVAHLESKLQAIGSDRASTKPYAKTLASIQTLEKQKEALLTLHETHLTQKAKVETKKTDLHQKTAQKEALESTIKRKENTLKRNRYEAIKKLIEEKEVKQKHLESLDTYKDFNPEDLESYQKYTHELNTQKERLEEFERSIQETETTVHQLKQTQAEPIDIDTLKEDRRKILELERTIDYQTLKTLKAEQNQQLNSIQALTTEKTRLELNKQKRLKRWFLILPLFIVVIYKLKLRKIIHRLINLRNQKDLIDRELETINTLIDEKKKLLTKYQASSDEAFEDYYEKALENLNLIQTINTQTETLNTLTKKRNTLQNTIKTTKEHLKALEHKYDVKDYEGLKNTRDKHKLYSAHKRDIETLKTRINDQLDGIDFKTYEASIDFEAKPSDPNDLDALKETYETLTTEIQDLKLFIERTESQIETEEKQHLPLETIEQLLHQHESKKAAYVKEKATIEQARKRIEAAMKTIEENFAPVLSEKIKTYLQTFTANTYSDIRVAKNLMFKVYSNQYAQFESELHFSQGTTDQVYFAMRLGMLDALNQSHLPLLLDDAFVSYDNDRLKHVLNVLKTMQKTRQIILFTCHSREHDFSKAINLNHHYIALSETPEI